MSPALSGVVERDLSEMCVIAVRDLLHRQRCIRLRRRGGAEHQYRAGENSNELQAAGGWRMAVIAT